MNTLSKNLVINVLLLSTAPLISCTKSAESDTASALMAVDVATPIVDSIVLYKSYPGTLTANEEVNLVARVNGYLVAKPYKPGDFVKKGTTLYLIEDAAYRNAVAQAQAQLETARATNIYAQNQYEAMKKALASDAVSQMDVIQAKSNLDESIASIENAEAALLTAQTNLGYCTVKAPVDGRVSSCPYGVGDYLSGSASPVTLGRIFNDDLMVATFNIDDDQYIDFVNSDKGKDKIDYSHMPVTFSEQLPHSYTADLYYMSPSIDSSTGTMTVKAHISNPFQELKSGMYLTIGLPYSIAPKAILINDASIGTDQLGKYVYVVNDSNKVVYTPVKVGGIVNDTLRVVTDGLTPDSRYVTKALLKVRDGMSVKPVMN
jgi:RND family efflux transporter MFP subunit